MVKLLSITVPPTFIPGTSSKIELNFWIAIKTLAPLTRKYMNLVATTQQIRRKLYKPRTRQIRELTLLLHLLFFIEFLPFQSALRSFAQPWLLSLIRLPSPQFIGLDHQTEGSWLMQVIPCIIYLPKVRVRLRICYHLIVRNPTYPSPFFLKKRFGDEC